MSRQLPYTPGRRREITLVPFNLAVTQDDIDKGVPKDGFKCPVALALQRRGYTHAYVEALWWTDSVPHPDTGLPVLFSVEWEHQSYVQAFDTGLPVAPVVLRQAGPPLT